MGLFDRLRRKSAPPPPPVPAEPSWFVEPPLAIAMKIAIELTGDLTDPHAMSVHAAIDAALARVYPEPPLAYMRVPWAALACVRVYRAAAGFHYLGWGLTEMGPKVSPDPAISGDGIELSLELAAKPGDTVLAAPLWPVELLARLAAGIVRTGQPYDDGHWIEANGTFGPERIGHLGCAYDAAIPPVDTPNGRFRYIQVFPLTADELAAYKQADLERRPPPAPLDRVIRPRDVA